MSEELSLIIAIVGLVASLIAILSFALGRRDKGREQGKEHGEMENDIKYIKQIQTNIAVDQKEILHKLDKTAERVTRLEEQEKMLERRVNKLENGGKGA